MRLKSYFSGSVEAAMVLARKELGEDALLINARPATPETRYLGAYEVVFGIAPDVRTAAPAPARPSPDESDRQLRDELAEMRRQIDRLAMSFEPSSRMEVAAAPSIGNPLQSLLTEELDADLVEQIARGSRLEDLFRVDPILGSSGAPAVVALVGPPGVGKTTTLVKLAVAQGIAKKRPVHLLSLDVNRIAAADQLRTFAAILGLACDVVETPQALEQRLTEIPSKTLVLIDTPGFGAREIDDADELACAIARGGIDTHLVLPASMKAADLERAASNYLRFRPSRLLFTRLDETSRYGALVSLAAKRELPVSFLCTGQSIPEDIEEATLRRLVELVIGDAPVPAPLRMGAAA